MMPSTTPRLVLVDHLSDSTHSAIMRIAYEVGIQPDDVNDCRYTSWLIFVLQHIRDTPRNFPRGKWHTIKTLEKLVDEAAKEIALLLYGNV